MVGLRDGKKGVFREDVIIEVKERAGESSTVLSISCFFVSCQMLGMTRIVAGEFTNQKW